MLIIFPEFFSIKDFASARLIPFNFPVSINVLHELNKNLSILNIIPVNDDGLLKNKTFMLTGKLNNISRAEAKSLIEKNSGKIISNVNKKLDYLIIGEKPTIKKVNTAKEMGIQILSQTELIKMLNKTS